MRAELGDDSPLLEKVIPGYPPYGKRILIDNHWFKMLKRPSHAGVQNWYKNDQGRVFALSPWRLADYWRMTSEINTSDYIFK